MKCGILYNILISVILLLGSFGCSSRITGLSILEEERNNIRNTFLIPDSLGIPNYLYLSDGKIKERKCPIHLDSLPKIGSTVCLGDFSSDAPELTCLRYCDYNHAADVSRLALVEVDDVEYGLLFDNDCRVKLISTEDKKFSICGLSVGSKIDIYDVEYSTVRGFPFVYIVCNSCLGLIDPVSSTIYRFEMASESYIGMFLNKFGYFKGFLKYGIPKQLTPK